MGPWGSVQNMAPLKPSASPAPGGAHEWDGDRPMAGVGGREQEALARGLDWVSFSWPQLAALALRSGHTPLPQPLLLRVGLRSGRIGVSCFDCPRATCLTTVPGLCVIPSPGPPAWPSCPNMPKPQATRASPNWKPVLLPSPPAPSQGQSAGSLSPQCPLSTLSLPTACPPRQDV